MHLTKRMLSLLLALFFTLLLPLYCFAASNLSPATTITDGAYYYIRNKNSGHYLDAENSLNFNVIQYAYHGALNQTWKAVRISGNTYRFVLLQLNAHNAAVDDNRKLRQYLYR